MANRPRKTRKFAVAHTDPKDDGIQLVWLHVSYSFHTFAYRDPRAAFSSAIGIPVVSPTAVLLGIVSTLFCLGRANDALEFVGAIHHCKVVIDPPEGIIFYRAFHQLRRYETEKYGPNPRLGLTNISQGVREYGLVDGPITIYVGVPENLVECARVALLNRDHLGTHDSLCSVRSVPEICSEPSHIPFWSPEQWQTTIPSETGLTVLMSSRLKSVILQPEVGNYWWMTGGDSTEIVPFLIKGRFFGTSRGKIFRKH